MCNGAKKCGPAKQLMGPLLAAALVYAMAEYGGAGTSLAGGRLFMCTFTGAFLGQLIAASLPNASQE